MFSLRKKIGRLWQRIDKTLVVLILLSLLPLFPLLHPGMFNGHDSESHVARLVAFYQSLSEGNVIPRWAGELNNGFGHPILMFLYPLPNYLGSVWHFLGFSFTDSVKMTFALAYILSGIFMYLFARKLVSQKTALLVSILYLFAPYRFVDLYVRAALGEHVAFMAMPLVLLCFYQLYIEQKVKNLIFASLSICLLLLSHNAISLMFLPLFLICSLIIILNNNQKTKNALNFFLAFILGFGQSAFFWLPAFLEGKYTLRGALTGSEYYKNFPSFISFLTGDWNYGGSLEFSKQIGIFHWAVVLSGILLLSLIKNKKYLWYLLFTIELFFWLSLFLMNKASQPIWQIIIIMQKFQFPWRFLSLSVLTSSLAGLVWGKLPFSLAKNKLIIFCFSLLVVFSSFTFWHPKGYLSLTDYYFEKQYQGTTDTGESSPRWSIRGMEVKSNQTLQVIDGEAVIKKIKRTTTRHEYDVKVAKRTRFVEETVYFPGWVINANGHEQEVEFQDSNYRGLLTFYLNPGKWHVDVSFQETKLRQTANLISLLSFVTVFVILSISFVSKIRNKYQQKKN